MAQQCSSSRIPIYDPLLEKTFATTWSPATVKKHKHGWSSKGKKRIEEDEIGDVKWKVDENEDDFKSFYETDSSSSPSTQNRDVKKPITLVQLKKPDEYVMDDNVAEGSGNGPPYNETNYGKYEISLFRSFSDFICCIFISFCSPSLLFFFAKSNSQLLGFVRHSPA